MAKPAASCILEIPLERLLEIAFAIDHISPQRFRFLDCQSFVKQHVLRLLEYSELPIGAYAAVSYVWRGLCVINNEEPPMGSFSVKGAEHADRLSIDVLQSACLVSLYLKSDMIWLDRLCIIQNNKTDKNWQIMNMHNIYKSCKACIVLPGGLVRLATINEETSWIHRAWTLQEVLAAPTTRCLFSWTHGHSTFRTNSFFDILEIEPQRSAIADLLGLLRVSIKTVKLLGFTPRILADPTGSGFAHLESLESAMTESNPGARHTAIWRCAYIRTSSRPIDMIFSIMGLLNAPLDPSRFRSQDRQAATIALLRTILATEPHAYWLGLGYRLPAEPTMNLLPVMPKTSVEGKAFVHGPCGEVEAGMLLRETRWWLGDAPVGRLGEDGYFVFRAKAVSARRVGDPCLEVDYGLEQGDLVKLLTDDLADRYELCEGLLGPPYAVVIGRKTMFLSGAFSAWVERQSVLLMLLEEHGTGRFHRVGYKTIEEEAIGGWEERLFEVGGPEDL